MRLHIKNILAGVGTGAVVVLLGVLSIMSFASVNSSGTAQLTIIKHVVPPSIHDVSNHRDIEFDFKVYKVRESGNIFEFGETLDDDGVDADPNYPEPKSRTVYAGYSPGLHVIEEIPVKDIYNTSWECYYDNHRGEGDIHGFGTKTYDTLGLGVVLIENDPMTCEFTNVLATATLNITKNIEPDSSDKVDFDIFTDNDNEHSNGYDYFFLGDNGTHSTKMIPGINFNVSEYSGARVSSPQFYPKYSTNISCTSSIPSKSFTKNNQSFFDKYVFDDGETLDCVFTNTKNPEIVVKKIVDPVPNTNDEHFNFGIGLVNQVRLAEFSLLSGEETNPSYYVKPSTQYNVEELLSNGQSSTYRTSIHCDYYDASGNKYSEDDKEARKIGISLGASQKAICTFTNHLLDVTVKKVVLDENGNEIQNDNNIFEFITNLQINPFNLDGNPNQAPESEKKLYFNTSDGIKITENLTHDQGLQYKTTYECVDHDGTQLKADEGVKVELTNLNIGNYGITCTFTNKQLPDALVFVHKKFDLVGDDSWDYDDVAHVRVGPSSDLTKGEEKSILHDHNQTWEVRPGDITVNEYLIEQFGNDPLHSYIPNYYCVFLSPSTRQPITANNVAKVNIPDLKSGERVQCTLTNKEVASALKIKKDVVASNGKDLTDDIGVFSFKNHNTGDIFKLDDNANLPDPSEKIFEFNPNTNYAFSEISIPSGYTSSFKCVDDKTGNVLDQGQGTEDADITLDENQSATCTFTNTKAVATLIIAKDVVGKDDDTNVFKILNDTGIGEFYLDDNSNQAPDSTKEITVPAGGIYNFSEDLTPEQASNYKTTWKCTDRNNSSGTGASFIAPTLGTNESMTCTFVNTIISTLITIRKDVKKDDGTDITDDKEVFQIENTTENYNLKPLDDNQNDPTYSNEDTITVNPALLKFSFLEEMTPEQEINYTPSWECKLGNVIVKSAPNSASILNVPINKGDHIICTITNVKKTFNQKITVKKITKPSGGTTLFPMYIHPEIGVNKTGSIKDGGSLTHTVKADNNITIKELNSGSYGTVTYSCRYIPGNTTYHPFAGNGREIPKFFLPKGQDAECTFTNCKQTQTGPGGLLECPLYSDPNVGHGGNVVGGGNGGNQ